MKQGDMILIEVSGQYEFARIDGMPQGYIDITTMSGACLSGVFDDSRLQRYMRIGQERYAIQPCTGAEPGWDRAMEFFELGRYASSLSEEERKDLNHSDCYPLTSQAHIQRR